MKRTWGITALLCAGMLSGAAFAQELPEGDAPTAVPAPAPLLVQAPGTNPDQPVERRRVNRFVVEGNTLLKDEEIRRVLAPYEGKELSLAEMKDVAKNLTALYQRSGYYLVRALIPKQDFATDQVRITVVEGKIGKISVEGAEYYDPKFIEDRFKQSMPEGVFNSDDFQRAMILLNELPDLKVRAVLQPGQDVGTADVVLKVEDALPIHGSVDYNNYGTPETGINRVGLGFEAGNLLTDADQISLRGVLGFPSRQNNFFQVQYQMPVNLDGTTVAASYANGAFAVSQGLGAILDVRGNADIYTLAVSHPLERELDFASNLGFAVSHKSINNNFFGGAFPFSRDEYTSGRLTYQADWRGVNGRTILQAAWTQGFGGTPATDPLVSRVGASGGFSKFNFDLGRVQTFDTGLYGVLRGSAQVASQPLYVAEQFALGGPDTVRGFGQAELLGDDAYLVSAELRWSPIHDAIDTFQMAFFVDHGGVSLRRPQPGDLPFGNRLTGAGFGFRFGLWENANLRLDLGWPIWPRTNRQGDNPAVYAGLQTRF